MAAAGRGMTGLLTLVAFLVLGRADQAAAAVPSGSTTTDAWQDQAGDLQLSYVQVGDVGKDSTLPPPRLE
jgi:hypothetical protein